MKPFHTKKNREIFDGVVVVILLDLLGARKDCFHHSH